MRFQVPQNLDDPDKILFGLSFKQLLYIGGSVGFLMFLFFFGGGILIVLIFGVPVAILGLLLAFFTYNNQPFIILLQAMIRFVSGKKKYIWKRFSNSSQEEVVLIREGDENNFEVNLDKEKMKEINANLVFSDTDKFDEVADDEIKI